MVSRAGPLRRAQRGETTPARFPLPAITGPGAEAGAGIVCSPRERWRSGRR
jgi:hypothetical protein